MSFKASAALVAAIRLGPGGTKRGMQVERD
jgi:hypothetical protein